MWQEQISSCTIDPIRETNFEIVRKLLQVKIPDEELYNANLVDGLSIQVTATKPFTVNSFWIVKIQDIHREIEKDWITMRDLLWQEKFLADQDGNPDKPCLDRNEPQIFHQTNEVVTVKIQPPGPIDITNMPLPRDFYPLVVIVTCHEEEPERDANDVAANIHLIHIKDSVVPVKSHVIKNYTKQVDGKILDISRVYTEETQACMICFEDADPSIRVRLLCLLPCRHGPICSTCIQRIRECPKCRTFISSVFDIMGTANQTPVGQNSGDQADSDEARRRSKPVQSRFMASIKNFFGMS